MVNDLERSLTFGADFLNSGNSGQEHVARLSQTTHKPWPMGPTHWAIGIKWAFAYLPILLLNYILILFTT